MANMRMRRCFTLHDIKEIQIKAIRYHYTFIRMTGTQNIYSKHCQGCGAAGTLAHC